MEDDIDDTVPTPVRPSVVPAASVDEDTVLTADSLKLRPSAPVVAQHLSLENERQLPELVEPVREAQRRVPLTSSRLKETLRPDTAPRVSEVFPPPRPAAEPAAGVPLDHRSTSYGFRIADRAPVSLDVPALIGRRPTAPRIARAGFPRLVRVASPRSEVSSTHIELRQDGSSVIVTDLRSTNGTIVRMPGTRPVKLRHNESLVVRPGTQVDIGDGNVIEILAPPRLVLLDDPETRGNQG